ncbi:hypothetical protein F5Y10DRAFT_246498 [Nemania abortiva]|nr:hypothetical protein F5Y10DRAFT_246498 [Nemania abortiva]
MSKSNDPNRDKRPSFSLSSGFQSVKRAVSGRGRKSEKEVEASTSGLDSSNPFADPPPAYTITPAEPSKSSQNAQDDPAQSAPKRVLSFYSRIRNNDDKLGFLAEFDTVFVIDDSSSMKFNDWGNSRSATGQASRWEQTKAVIAQMVPICMEYDQDGVDIYFLNDPFHRDPFNSHRGEPGWSKAADSNEGKASFGYIGVKDAQDVKTIFNGRVPNSATPTGERLREIMTSYVNCYRARGNSGQELPKPLNIIVITDGAATDRVVLTNSLIERAEDLDSLGAPYHQMGVQFFQVGKDQEAANYLKELDDDLGKYREGKELRDIVDCITFHDLVDKHNSTTLTADILLKAVLGSVNRHLDNQRIRQGLLVPPRQN